MYAVIGAITQLSLAGHLVLLVLMLYRRRALRLPLAWSVLPVLVAVVILLPLVLPLNTLPGGPAGLGFVLTLASTGYVAAFGVTALRDATGRKGRLWLVVALLWQLALVATILLSAPSVMGRAGWLQNLFVSPSAAPLVTVGGFTGVALYLLGTLTRCYLQARLPEAANRALFWFATSAFALMSVLFLMSGSTVLLLLGVLLLSLASAGGGYLLLAPQVLDIRTHLGGVARSLALLALGSLIILGTFGLASEVNPDALDAPLFVVVLAATASVLFAAVELALRSLAVRASASRASGFASAAERLSRELVAADSLQALNAVVTAALRRDLNAVDGMLLAVERLPGGGYALTNTDGSGTALATLAADSPFARRMAQERDAITQDALNRSNAFAASGSDERAAIERLGLQVYVPVLLGDAWLGVIGGGRRADDSPYGQDDLTRLSMLSSLTAVAWNGVRQAEARRAADGNADALNAQLADAMRQIERLDAVKADFVAVASHELRTPLAQIRGNVDLLDALNAAGALEPAQTAEVVANMRSATERLEALVSALLDASEIDSGLLTLQRERVQLEDIIRAAADPLASAIRQRRIGVGIHGLRDLPAIDGDAARLTQAVRNVLLNAIKYTPDGGQIEISAQTAPARNYGGDSLVLAVKDEGVGIAAENLSLIFRKFYRGRDAGTHSSSETKFMGAGPGLGLSIVRGIVEAHGGAVWAESDGYDPARCPGTTVFIRLPVAGAEDDSQASAVSDSERSAASS